MSLLGDGVRRLVAPDGSEVVLRPPAPADAPHLSALYRDLPADAWVRHVGVCDGHDRGAAVRAATVVARGGTGLVAVGAEHRLVGVTLVEPPAGGSGRLTLAVAPHWRDWLGPRLLAAVLDEATAAGVATVEVEVMRIDTWMLDLVTSYGHVALPTEEWLTVRLALGTAGDLPRWEGAPGPRVLVETPGDHWHAAAAARRAGMSVMVCPGPPARRSCCPLAEGRPCPLVTGADVVVVSYPPGDPRWDELVESHAQLHPGVPVVVEGHRGEALPAGVTPLGVHDPDAVVARVATLAAGRRDSRS